MEIQHNVLGVQGLNEWGQIILKPRALGQRTLVMSLPPTIQEDYQLFKYDLIITICSKYENRTETNVLMQVHMFIFSVL